MFSKVLTLAMASAASLSALSAVAQTPKAQDLPAQPSAPAAGQPQDAPDRYAPSRHYQRSDEPGGQTAQDPSGALQTGQTETCRYKTGPRAGITVDYSTMPGVTPVHVGARCADMQGSSGDAIASETAGQSGQMARPEEQGRHYQSLSDPNAQAAFDASGQPRAGYTLTCRFTDGPRRGSSWNFTGTLGAIPVALGAPCADANSKGVGVAPSSSDHPYR